FPVDILSAKGDRANLHWFCYDRVIDPNHNVRIKAFEDTVNRTDRDHLAPASRPSSPRWFPHSESEAQRQSLVLGDPYHHQAEGVGYGKANRGKHSDGFLFD